MTRKANLSQNSFESSKSEIFTNADNASDHSTKSKKKKQIGIDFKHSPLKNLLNKISVTPSPSPSESPAPSVSSSTLSARTATRSIPSSVPTSTASTVPSHSEPHVKQQQQVPSIIVRKPEEERIDTITEFDEIDLIPKFNQLEELISHHSELNDNILLKLEKLNLVNNSIEEILTTSIQQPQQLQQPQQQYQTQQTFPTPIDDYDEHYNEKEIILDDIPSSPESYKSSTSHIEIELMDKLSRFAQLNNNNSDFLKLKNIVNSTLEVINFGVLNEDDETITRVIDLNDDSYKKSQIVLDKLINLVETFT